jgi:hypothetical protein
MSHTVLTDMLAKVYADHDRWQVRADNARARIDKARAQADRAEKTLESCYAHLSTRAVTEQVAALVARYFPHRKLDVLGPFGLGHETAIHVSDSTGLTIAGVSFRPGDNNRLHLIDWSHNTGRFPANSIGAINQFNFDTYPEPATLHDIVLKLDAEISAHEREETNSQTQE